MTVSVPLIVALILVIVGIVFAVIDAGWRNPIFWFVLAFAVIYIIAPAIDRAP
jgi:predicted cobalt transporter CbtA